MGQKIGRYRRNRHFGVPARPDAKAIREWGIARGMKVKARGRLPVAVVEEYDKEKENGEENTLQ